MNKWKQYMLTVQNKIILSLNINNHPCNSILHRANKVYGKKRNVQSTGIWNDDLYFKVEGLEGGIIDFASLKARKY